MIVEHGPGESIMFANSIAAGKSVAPLDNYGWLAEQPKDFICWAKSVGSWREYSANQVVCESGEPAEGIHGLAQGSLEVTFPLLAEETVTVYRADVGFWIGDDSGFDRTPRLVGLVATKPSRLLHIANRDIRMLLERSPHYWQAFQKLNASNLKKAVTLLSEALSLSVRARVCRRLYEMTRGRHGFDAEITQSDLARLVGVSRPTMRRCLKGLSNLGIVTLKYGKVAIPDHTALKLFFDER